MAPERTAEQSAPAVAQPRRLPLYVGAAVAALAAVAIGAAARQGPEQLGDALYRLGFWCAKPFDRSVLLQDRGLSFPHTLGERNVVLVGGHEGYGFQAAKWFKALGANLIVSGPDAASAQAAADSIAEVVGGAGAVLGLPLDLADMPGGSSMREFVLQVARKVKSINYLVLNTREAGPNVPYAAGYLGQFALAVLLAPYLEPGAGLMLASGLGAWVAPLDSPLELLRGPSSSASGRPSEREASALASLCLARALRPRLLNRSISVVAMAPGMVASGGGAGISLERVGEKLFEAAFVNTVVSHVDFAYPFWFPSYVFRWHASPASWATRVWLEGHAFFSGAELRQSWDSNLHGSIGPQCDPALQAELLEASRVAAKLPASAVAGELTEVSEGMPKPQHSELRQEAMRRGKMAPGKRKDKSNLQKAMHALGGRGGRRAKRGPLR